MHRFSINTALFLLMAAALWSADAQDAQKPSFSMTYNAMETAVFIVANKALVRNRDLIYIPLHFDAAMKIDNLLGLSFGLVYRYEDYHDQGPLYRKRGNIRPTQIWTKYHELFLLLGPRFSLLKTGLDGFFVSLKGGLGFAISPQYFGLSALLEPDVGYSFCFNNPGFTLTLGAGVLLNMPFYETLPFAVPWDKEFKGYNAIGVLVHQATPIINVGVGFNL